MTSTKRRLAPLQNAQQCQRFTPGWTCDRIYAEWQTQGPKIQQQQRKEATATPIIKIAESIRRWAHRYQKLQPVLIGLTFAGELTSVFGSLNPFLYERSWRRIAVRSSLRIIADIK